MILTIEAANALLEELRHRKEKEWFEFKKAKNDYLFEDLGRYFSAISNEANLKGIQFYALSKKENKILNIGTNRKAKLVLTK